VDHKDTIAHYNIIKKIGSGGMGEVYLAEDTRLNRNVAIKMLPVEFTKDKERIRRFEREARALSVLNHPYILTVHDIGQNDSSTFIVSEYIEGETLRQRIRSDKIPLKEILTIVIQVAEALDAAHRVGIIHRDIKPENIMLRHDGYVKLLDFGLSKTMETETSSEISNIETSTRTQQGVVLGTTRYMSPEQIRGLKLDARSDIFSLGVVSYELIAGNFPFNGATSADIVASILEKHPAPLRTHGQFPEELQWIITKMLAKDLEERYQTTKDLLADLKRLRKGLDISEEVKLRDSTSAPNLSSKVRSAGVSLALIGILVITAVLFTYVFLGKDKNSAFPTDKQSIVQKVRPSIAVIGFKNLSSNSKDAWLSVALAEMLTTELAQGEQLRAIAGETVHRVKNELSLPDVQAFEKTTLNRLGKNLATDYVLIGSYLTSGKSIRLDLTLQDTRSGETKTSFSENGSLEELFELASQTGSKLRGYFEVQPISKSAEAASFSSNPEAIRLYAEGLSKLRLFDYGGAKDDLEKAVEMESHFTIARSALSLAWTKIGYRKKAKDEARKAMNLSSNLSREERLLIQARYHQAAEEYEKAAEIYQTLFELFPDNVEYGLLLAETKLEIGKAQDALKVIRSLRSIPSAQKNDPRIDTTEAKTLRTLGDFKGMLPKLADAVRKSEDIGARRLLALAYDLQADAFYTLGESEKSQELYEKSNQLYTAIGDQDRVAEDLIWKGKQLIEKGKSKDGENLLNEALRIYETTGNRFGVAGVYFEIARVAQDPNSADQSFSLAFRKAEEIEHKEYMATILNNWGIRVWHDGNIRAAERHFEKGIALYRQLAMPEYTATMLINLSSLYEDQGKLKKAEELKKESLELLRRFGHKPDWAKMNMTLSELYRQNGRLDEAMQACKQSLSVARETDEKSEIARALAMEAIILIDQGKLSEAKKNWEEAMQIDKDARWVSSVTWDLLLTEGKLKDLTAEYDNAKKDFDGEIRIAMLKKDVKPAESRKLALKVLNEKKDLAVNLKAILHSIIAQTYLNEGNIVEAERALADVESLRDQISEFFSDRITVDLVQARLFSAKGDHRKANELLQALLIETQKAGYVPLEYEVRLTLGEIQLKSGKQKEGTSTLEKMKSDASKNGYLFVSNKASALLNL
jgi:serine/threonine protein kinase/Tfp pilus assembly protein PilF/thioredoxin-like negative regulator of GroEL